MTDPARIVLVTPKPETGQALAARLGSGFEVRVQSPSEAALGLPTSAAIVLDGRLGAARLHALLLHISHDVTGTAIVVCAGDRTDTSPAAFIRMGAQDVFDPDALPDDMLRDRVSMAIERARILGITQEAALHIRSVVEHVSDALVIVDDAREVVFANPACEDMLRMPIEHLYGAPCPFPFDASTTSLVMDRPDGTSLHAGVFQHTIRWDGRMATMVTLRDLTQEAELRDTLVRARSAAEKTQELKASFLANMSHELRMPLASIIGFAELIEEGSTDAEMKEFAALIQESGSRLLSAINAVLDMSRLEAGKYEPVMAETDIATVIDGAVRLMRPLAVEKGLTLTASGPRPAMLLTDGVFVERIVNNLVGNAIKFTEAGSVSATWQMDDSGLNIVIQDTGIGISETFLPELFDEFTQESTGRSRTHDGTGLGLSITRKLVERLGGTIDVASTKGAGTTFTVHLPPSAP